MSKRLSFCESTLVLGPLLRVIRLFQVLFFSVPIGGSRLESGLHGRQTETQVTHCLRSLSSLITSSHLSESFYAFSFCNVQGFLIIRGKILEGPGQSTLAETRSLLSRNTFELNKLSVILSESFTTRANRIKKEKRHTTFLTMQKRTIT